MFLSLFLHCVISVHLCLSTYKRYNIHSVIVQTQILQNLSVMLQTLINASVWISSSCKEFSMIWNSTCCSNSSDQFKYSHERRRQWAQCVFCVQVYLWRFSASSPPLHHLQREVQQLSLGLFSPLDHLQDGDSPTELSPQSQHLLVRRLVVLTVLTTDEHHSN